MEFKCLIDILKDKKYVEDYGWDIGSFSEELSIRQINTKFVEVRDKMIEILEKTNDLIIYGSWQQCNGEYSVQYVKLENVINDLRKRKYQQAPHFYYYYENNIHKIMNAVENEFRFEYKAENDTYKIIDIEKEKFKIEKEKEAKRKHQEVRDFINSLP